MNTLKNQHKTARLHLVIGLVVSFSSFAHSTEVTDSRESVSTASAVVEYTASDIPFSEEKLAIAQEELRQMRSQLHEDRKKAKPANITTDEEIAARVVKMELLMAKQREVAALRRQKEDPAARAERHALQQRLASASTQAERQVIIERHVAIQSVLAEEAAKQTSTR